MKKMKHVVIGERTLRVTEAAVETYVRQRTKDVARPRPRRASPRRNAGVLPASSPVASSANGRPELRVVQPRTRPRAI
jgi:hypothetical protein